MESIYCPLGFGAANREDTPCYKEECVWWVVEAGECAISNLAVSFDKIVNWYKEA